MAGGSLGVLEVVLDGFLDQMAGRSDGLAQ